MGMGTSAIKNASKTTTARQMNKRRLSFAPEISQVVGTVLSRDDITAQEKKSCWYSYNDYVDIRNEARDVVEITHINHGELPKMLQASYKLIHDIVDRFLDDDEFERLMINPSHHASVLEVWCLSSNDRRGLEKSMSKFITKQRSTDAREARGMVFQTGLMRLSSIEIAQAYAVESRLSCVYARIMAHADYRSAYCMGSDSKTSTATTTTAAAAPASKNTQLIKMKERLSPVLACSDTKDTGWRKYNAVIPRQARTHSTRRLLNSQL
jgi:hypothetical protein